MADKVLSAEPLISIITVTYNSEKYLLDVITAIRCQRYKNIEWIVVDGKSTDRTVEIIKENYDLVSHFICEEDDGMYDALVKGFQVATGEIGYWLNSDDIIFPWTCEVVASIFANNDNCDWITGLKCNLDVSGIPYPWIPMVYPRSVISSGLCHGKSWGFIQQESTFFRMELYKKVGGLIDGYRLAGDFDLWKRMAKYSYLYSVRIPLGAFRIHENQLSSNVNEYYSEVSKSGGKNFKILKFISLLYSVSLFLLSRKRKNIFVGRTPI